VTFPERRETSASKGPRLGERLVADGLLSESALSRALHVQKHAEQKMRFGTVLLDRDLLGEDALLKALGIQHRCEAVSWKTLSMAPTKVVNLLPERAATRLGAIPYALTDGRLQVAFLDPSNIAAVDEVSAITGKPVRAAVTTELRLLQAHNRFYGRRLPVQLHVAVQRLERRESTRSAVARPSAAPATIPPPPPNPFTPAPTERHFDAARPGFTFEEPPLPTPALVAEAVQKFAIESPPAPVVVPVQTGEPALPVDEETVESLSEWMEEAIGSLWGDPPAPPSDADGEAADPGGAGGALWMAEAPRTDSVAASVASGLWNEEALPITTDPEGLDIEVVLPEFPRVILFLLGKTSISAWKGRGRGVPLDALHRLRIALGEKDVFFLVEASGAPHYGPLDRSLWPAIMAELFGSVPPECAVFPVRVEGQMQGFLYADRLGSAIPYETFPAVARAAAAVAAPLSRHVRRQRATVL
jgi:hypothetical protein